MSAKIGTFQVIDHGIEHSQYFQGCGTAYTRYENVATGIGEDFAAAVDDCLESIAQSGFDVEGMEARISEDIGGYPDPANCERVSSYISANREKWLTVVDESDIDDDDDDDGCELYYHVSIRFSPDDTDDTDDDEFPVATHRQWECTCGNVWIAPVTPGNSLTGEQPIPFCTCGKRAIMGSPIIASNTDDA